MQNSKWKTINSNWPGKVYVRNEQTGEVRKVIVDQEYRKATERGYFLQPNDPRFFKKYPHMKVIDGKLVDTDLEYAKKEKEEREFQEANEKAIFNNKQI